MANEICLYCINIYFPNNLKIIYISIFLIKEYLYRINNIVCVYVCVIFKAEITNHTKDKILIMRRFLKFLL